MKVILAKQALADLADIADWISQDNPQRARTFAAELRAACKGLARYPRRFQRVGRYSGREVRRRVQGNYLIFYEVGQTEVRIIRVVHGARDYEPLLFPDETSE